jgi:hypothetical protein
VFSPRLYVLGFGLDLTCGEVLGLFFRGVAFSADVVRYNGFGQGLGAGLELATGTAGFVVGRCRCWSEAVLGLGPGGFVLSFLLPYCVYLLPFLLHCLFSFLLIFLFLLGVLGHPPDCVVCLWFFFLWLL